jgi:hypothetical protein
MNPAIPQRTPITKIVLEEAFVIRTDGVNAITNIMIGQVIANTLSLNTTILD